MEKIPVDIANHFVHQCIKLRLGGVGADLKFELPLRIGTPLREPDDDERKKSATRRRLAVKRHCTRTDKLMIGMRANT